MNDITPHVPTRQRDPWREYAAGRLTPQEIRELAATIPAPRRHPNRGGKWRRPVKTAGAAFALVLVLTVAGHHAHHGQAFAGIPAATVITLTAQHTPTPVQKTCAAFTAWQHHHTTTRLDAIMTASFRAPWKYVGEDAADLYRAVRAGKNTDTAVQYFYEDCHNGSGL